jgi:hypothetical protein
VVQKTGRVGVGERRPRAPLGELVAELRLDVNETDAGVGLGLADADRAVRQVDVAPP